jgi:ribosome-associated heat shock protein Hsp15
LTQRVRGRECIDVQPVIVQHSGHAPRFELDVHQGRLADYLRLVGFDTRYANDADDDALVKQSRDETRTLLTRDTGLLRRATLTDAAFVCETGPRRQRREVLDRFELAGGLPRSPAARIATAASDRSAGQPLRHMSRHAYSHRTLASSAALTAAASIGAAHMNRACGRAWRRSGCSSNVDVCPRSIPPMNEIPTVDTVRLDLWLWAARFYRTRSLAKQALETGKVDVGGQRAKASRAVRIGDALRVVRGEEIFEVEVRGLSDTRGPASVAHLLYAESDTSRLAREQVRAQRAAERNGYRAPESKPDKRARRLIRALGDLDAL